MSINPKSRLKKNAAFNSGSFVFISVVNFFTLPYIVAKMGLEIFGIYALLTGLFGYFGIFDFGLGQGLVKFVSEFHATSQTKKTLLAVNSCFWFQVLTGLLVVSSLYVFSSDIIRLFNVSPKNFFQSVFAFKMALVGLFISFVSSVFSSILMGVQRYDLTSSVDSFANFLLNISLVAILINYKINLTQAVLLSVAFSFATMVTYVVLVHKNLSGYKLRFQFNWAIIKQFIKYSINIFLSKVSSLFSNYIVRFILAYFLTPAAVTLFVVPTKLLTALGGVLSSGSNAIFPYISSLKAQKSMEVIRQAFIQATTAFAAISIPAFLFLSLYSRQILSVWMGNAFAEQTWLLLTVMSISCLIASSSTIPNLVILGMGNSRLIALFSFISIVLYIGLLPLFTAKFGLTGCAFAMLLNSSVTIVFVYRFNLKYVRISFSEYIKSAYSKHLLPAFLFVVIGLAVNWFARISNYYVLAFGLVFIAAYYYFLYQNVYLKLTGRSADQFAVLARAS